MMRENVTVWNQTADTMMTLSAVHFFICEDSSEGEFASLTDKQIEKYSGQFAEIPQFTGHEPELAPRMTIIAF